MVRTILSLVLLTACLLTPRSTEAAENSFNRSALFKDAVDGSFILLKSKLHAGMLRELDSAESISIDITSSSLSHCLGGRFDRIVITVNKGIIEGMCIDRAFFDFKAPIIDLKILWEEGKLRLENAGPIDMHLIVLQEDLNQFLREKAQKLKVKNPGIELKPGRIYLKGQTEWWIFQSEFRARGTFSIRESKKIFFHPDKLELARVRMPSFVINQVVKKINPVLDMSSLPFDVRLATIKLEEGIMTITSFEKPD